MNFIFNLPFLQLLHLFVFFNRFSWVVSFSTQPICHFWRASRNLALKQKNVKIRIDDLVQTFLLGGAIPALNGGLFGPPLVFGTGAPPVLIENLPPSDRLNTSIIKSNSKFKDTQEMNLNCKTGKLFINLFNHKTLTNTSQQLKLKISYISLKERGDLEKEKC